MHSPEYSDDRQQANEAFAYDIYVSAREIHHILHAAAQGHPLLNMAGNDQMITAQEALEGLDTHKYQLLDSRARSSHLGDDSAPE